MTGELSRTDVKEISLGAIDAYKEIKPEKELPVRELNDIVGAELDKAAMEARIRDVAGDSAEKGLSDEEAPKAKEESKTKEDKAVKDVKSPNIADVPEKNSLSELSDEERLKIKKETNWSDEIIDNIKNMDQYAIYKKADLHEVEIDGRNCLVKDIDMDYVDPKTNLTNRELMKLGRAPYDSNTGEKIALHHMGQESDGPLAELCETTEHGDGNSPILHPKKEESWRRDPELKNKFNNQERPKHWKARSGEA